MGHTSQHIHSEASLHRKLVLFAVQLEGYLAHFPNCHRYALTQQIRVAFVDVYNLITAIRADARHGRMDALVSRLGCARRTCSLSPPVDLPERPSPCRL